MSPQPRQYGYFGTADSALPCCRRVVQPTRRGSKGRTQRGRATVTQLITLVVLMMQTTQGELPPDVAGEVKTMVENYLASRSGEEGAAMDGGQVGANGKEAALPLRVYVDYQKPAPGTASWQAEVLQQRVMPTVVAELSRLLSVKHPSQRPLVLPSGCRYYNEYFGSLGYYDSEYEEGELCDEQNDVRWCSKSLDLPHNPAFLDVPVTLCDEEGCRETSGEGLADTDFLLYVSTGHERCSHDSLAFALPCMLDQRTGRPVVGAAFFCDAFFTDSFDLMVQTALHEVMHALFFSNFLFPLYLDDRGRRRTANRVWEAVSLRGADWSGRQVITPRVVEEVQKVSGCEALRGAPVENDGGPGTEGSHWDPRFFNGDLMAGRRGMHMEFVTSLTLALALDSGWFSADMTRAAPLMYGRDAGCSFWRDTCKQYMERNPGQRFLCTPSTSTSFSFGCSTVGNRHGICLDSGLQGDGCGTVIADDWFISTVDCANPSSRLSSRLYNDARLSFLSYGPSAACTELEIESAPSGAVGEYVDCVSYTCDAAARLSVWLNVAGQEAVGVRCPSGKQVDIDTVDPRLSEFGGVKLGPCPDNELFCRTLTCPTGCGEKGFCYDGSCHCLPGWVGPSCGSPICTSHSSCEADHTCNPATGLCEPGNEGDDANGSQLSAQNHPSVLLDGPMDASTPSELGIGEWQQRVAVRQPLSNAQVIADVERLTSRGADPLGPPINDSSTFAENANGTADVVQLSTASMESGGGGGVDSAAAFWTACLLSSALLLATLW